MKCSSFQGMDATNGNHLLISSPKEHSNCPSTLLPHTFQKSCVQPPFDTSLLEDGSRKIWSLLCRFLFVLRPALAKFKVDADPNLSLSCLQLHDSIQVSSVSAEKQEEVTIATRCPVAF